MKRFLIFLGPLLVFIFLLSLTESNASNVKKPRKIIIDTDAGADDAVAILLALKYEAANKNDIDIIAITCTYGNTKRENVEKNVLKTLIIANRTDIPIYGGAESPLVKHWEDNHYFGIDGFGDFHFDKKIPISVNRSKHASVALIDLVKSNPNEVSIIALAPLTNIAMAIKLDPTFINFVKEFYIIGSSISGIGNVSPNVEFNFGADPESSFIVFNSSTKPNILIPWELALESPITKKWRNNVFGELKSKAVKFLNQAEAIVLINADSWISIDAIVIATFCWPNLINNSWTTNITPVYDGAAQGSVLVDYLNITGKLHNAKIIKSFDVELYKNKLLHYFRN
ncbi:inosine-uridine preferring nucleoside hydrolase-like isoform X2 [Leptopilina boulardi]|nr:inosine-uridine preferring nucleoside hydrolase-like isoform X2 [Leptopilina boulardi]XP_051160051.1 inosine-uridine preferring nucleoside hydrolase-like isoform X2 [Leptopilina boulardi]XP_051160052.1 inosine-uridine preferring nucleoside hydrolase-like isoform X2 [Leptopilina boulardi]XP_051160053.1 inosine-uridine preferring nucleoside hydrolase-like isoform X2 [Leptopilina boulardi]XP_051160054.1 inosine-uridine preferring nucleoside hydrolase-like isoform X2 [Leptopilina boulardi]XP_05